MLLPLVHILILCAFAAVETLRYVPKHLYNPSLQVKLPQGIIQGKIKYTVNSQMKYYSFEGIPYATPPTGLRRFKPPEPAGPWSGVLNTATWTPPACIQITPTIFSEGVAEGEDCLYVNVFTHTNLGGNDLVPTMVWIHGGGFLMGLPNASYYGPDYLLEQGVAVVHFGYRLNSFGFLSTGDKEAPGNFGLKDQRLALRWLKENLKYFGADPDRVTIFGESAGGASVQYHLLNLENEGLFQNAISQSGSALCLWAFQRNPRAIAFDLGFLAGIRTNDSKQLITYLQRISASKLKMLTILITLRYTLSIANGIAFAPTLEPEHEGAFFTQQAHQAMAEGKTLKVPYLLGFNSKEAFYAEAGFDYSQKLLEKLDADPRMLVPIDMNLDSDDILTVGEAIKKFYMENDTIPRYQQYLEFINDGYFLRPITESARLFSNVTSTFLYRFSYEGYYLGKRALGYGEGDVVTGVHHTEEMWYLFSRGDLTAANDTDRNVRTKMVKLWTNFAKYGDPTPHENDSDLDSIKWPKMGDTSKLTHVDINRKLVAKEDFKEEGVEFWRRMYTTYGRSPFGTY